FAVELKDYNVAALSLWPAAVKTEFIKDSVAAGAVEFDLDAAESPHFVGRCVAALATDPNIMDRTGGVYQVAELSEAYGFTDPDKD
ncbi:MAG: short-chain dehydrogenase, partial [Pseudomonadota bacterium]